MPNPNQEPQRHGFTPRTHVRVVREHDNREFPNMFVAYRELLGTPGELGYSEHQRMRATIRSTGAAVDRHGFTWKSMGGAVSENAIAWTDFTFGVELELVAPMSMRDMMDQLDRIASGFRVVHDGSLQSAPGFNAMEVVSPVLQGTEGLATLRKVMDHLRARGCRINSSCGMHVHIGVRGMKPERVRRIAIAFLNAEHHFDSLVPPSRRNNRYAQSNVARNVNALAIGNATTISALANAVNGGSSPQHYNPYRYYKLNFQSFVHHGTIEFRQHAGTVESDKACAWVRLITGFCAKAAGSTQQALGARESFEQWLNSCTDEAGQRYMQARRAKFSNTGVRREAA